MKWKGEGNKAITSCSHVEIFLLVIGLYSIFKVQLSLLCSFPLALALFFVAFEFWWNPVMRKIVEHLFPEGLWNSQLSLWMVGLKNSFIMKRLCYVFVSFVCNSQRRIILPSVHLWSSFVYAVINVQLFSAFTLGRNTLWERIKL